MSSPTLKHGFVEKYAIPTGPNPGQDGRIAARYWVHDQILVGGEICSREDGQHLEKDLGITHVLSLQYETSDAGKVVVPVCQLGMPDQGQEIPEGLIQTAIGFSRDVLSNPNNKLYIHCQLGGSRSPAFAYAVLQGCHIFGGKANVLSWVSNAKMQVPDWQGAWVPHAKYIESIDKVLGIPAGENHIIEPGTLNEDGKQVWDGASWVVHGHQLDPNDKTKWPKKLMKLRNGQWFPKTKLFVSTPTYFGQAFATYMGSLLQLSRGAAEMGIEVRLSWPRGDGIARCRNRQISEFFDTDCTHYVAIDADIGFNPQHLFDMVTSNLDITFGAYPAKGIEWEQLWKLMKVEGSPVTDHKMMETAALRFVVNYRPEDIAQNSFPTIEYPDGRLFLEVNEASTGFTCIRREVFEAMVKEYPELTYLDDYPSTRFRHQYNFFKMGVDDDAPHEQATRRLQQIALAVTEGKAETNDLVLAARAYKEAHGKLDKDEGLGRYLSEDYGFCRLAKRLGYKIFIYTQAHLSHTGLYTYEGTFSAQFGKNQSNPVKVPVPSRHTPATLETQPQETKSNGQPTPQPQP